MTAITYLHRCTEYWQYFIAKYMYHQMTSYNKDTSVTG
jgi:hypothetical protein